MTALPLFVPVLSFCADQGGLEVSRGVLRREPAVLTDEVEVEARREVAR